MESIINSEETNSEKKMCGKNKRDPHEEIPFEEISYLTIDHTGSMRQPAIKSLRHMIYFFSVGCRDLIPHN
jgi:hypothetical protein